MNHSSTSGTVGRVVLGTADWGLPVGLCAGGSWTTKPWDHRALGPLSPGTTEPRDHQALPGTTEPWNHRALGPPSPPWDH